MPDRMFRRSAPPLLLALVSFVSLVAGPVARANGAEPAPDPVSAAASVEGLATAVRLPALPAPAPAAAGGAAPAGAQAPKPAAASGSAPSGQAMPVGNLPGWRQVFTEDFTQNVGLGKFPAALASKWSAYPSPWKDTSKYGTYSPGKVVSVNGGVLTKDIHTEGGTPLVAALTPKLPGTSENGLTYGRFAVRFRADSLPGYKVAWMLWPDSGNRNRDGEIDFPEMDLDSSTMFGFVHRTDASSGSDQAWAKAKVDLNAWHTAIIEWTPGLIVFRLDGVEIGRSTERIPTTAMHWVLQTETELHGNAAPSAGVRGDVQIDWVAAWAYAPS
jgi:hypothetical protein